MSPTGNVASSNVANYRLGIGIGLCGGRFMVAEMNGFVVHLYRNEKVFHPQVGLV